MRRVFAAVETRQAELLDRLNIHWMDKGLRSARSMALRLFEQVWARAANQGVRLGEEDAADLYVHCLAKVLGTRGIVAAAESLPGSDVNPKPDRGRSMTRLRLFGRCRIYHDPVSPVLRAPAQVGWDAWFRTMDLVTPQTLKGEELLRRTKGWSTVEPKDVSEVIAAYGRIVVRGQR